MPRKIAPVLQGLAAHWKDHFEDTGDRAAATKELRALLAVASAVEREGDPACGCGPCRAMVRLRRLSNPDARKGKGKR